MHQDNIIVLLDNKALFLLGNIMLQRIAICLKEKKENKIKKEKKVWEDSCFQESKFVPVTPIVFCLSVDLDQSEALISFWNRPFDSGQREAPLF